MGTGTRRKALMGDWTPLVRDPLDLLRLAFVVGLVVTVAAGSRGEAIANMVAATAFVLVARTVQLPRVYDLAVIVAMAFTGFGEALGLYDSLPWYDNAVHVVVPMLTAQVAYLGLARLEVLPDPRDETRRRDDAAMFVITFALGMTIGGLWEIWEWTSDGLLGSELQLSNDDTVGDLVSDATGSLLGAGLLVAWSRWGWGSVRRIPGESRFEDTSA